MHIPTLYGDHCFVLFLQISCYQWFFYVFLRFWWFPFPHSRPNQRLLFEKRTPDRVDRSALWHRPVGWPRRVGPRGDFGWGELPSTTCYLLVWFVVLVFVCWFVDVCCFGFGLFSWFVVLLWGVLLVFVPYYLFVGCFLKTDKHSSMFNLSKGFKTSRFRALTRPPLYLLRIKRLAKHHPTGRLPPLAFQESAASETKHCLRGTRPEKNTHTL